MIILCPILYLKFCLGQHFNFKSVCTFILNMYTLMYVTYVYIYTHFVGQISVIEAYYFWATVSNLVKFSSAYWPSSSKSIKA